MPLDAEPVTNGPCTIDEKGVVHVSSGGLFDAVLSGVRYNPHHMTCPQGRLWRRK